MKLAGTSETQIGSELIVVNDGRKYCLQKEQRNNSVLGIVMKI